MITEYIYRMFTEWLQNDYRIYL